MDKLTLVDTISGGDWNVIYQQNSNSFRASTFTTMIDYYQNNLVFGGVESYKAQYNAPSATGFTAPSEYLITDKGSVHLILTPTGAFAAGTITLPNSDYLSNGVLYTVNSTQSVAALSIDLNGANSVVGAPASLTANGFFTLRYDLPTKNWYRIA